jgi:hypothetical protein
MTASPAVPAPATGVKGILGKLVGYAVKQLKANPAVVINGVTRLLSTLIERLPLSPRLKGTTNGALGTVSTIVLRDAVKPAPPAESALQAALARVKAGQR